MEIFVYANYIEFKEFKQHFVISFWFFYWLLLDLAWKYLNEIAIGILMSRKFKHKSKSYAKFAYNIEMRSEKNNKKINQI